MTTKKQRLFNVYVLTLKQSAKVTKDLKTHKYEIKKWECFYHVSRELAYHYMTCFDCLVIGMTKDKVVSVEDGSQLYGCGFMDNRRTFTFCVAEPVLPHADFGCIFPDHRHIGIKPSPVFNSKVERIKSLIFDADHSLGIVYCQKCKDIFVQEQLTPKGWEHITEGNIEEGDLIWERNDESYGYWRTLNYDDEGKPIEARSILFKSCGNEKKEESYSYYSPYVIRKKV